MSSASEPDLEVRLEAVDGEILAGIDSGPVSVAIAAPEDVDIEAVQEAVDDAERELEHSLEVYGFV